LRKGAFRRIDTRNSARNWDLKEQPGDEAGEWRNDEIREARTAELVRQELLKLN